MSSASTLSSIPAPDSKLPAVIRWVNPKTLKAHRLNCNIYGEDEDVCELINLIHTSGWVKPLVITIGGTIISGHRRWRAILAIGWDSIPVEVREFTRGASHFCRYA